MKTLFITGAEGFTGQHLVEYLRRRGYEVVGGVRNRARKLAFERKYGKALVCDVADAINVARAIASVRPDGVIHLAGTSQPHEATVEPLGAYQSIVSGWANVLDAVRRCVPRARVLLTSSCEVYGQAGDNPHPTNEDTPLNPVNTFGALKATAESIAHTFFNNYHTNVTIVRPFHYVGPGQSDRFFFAAVAKQLADWDPAVDGQELRLPDLNFQRDILHVTDVVEAYAYLLEEGRPNEAYNICSGKSYGVRQIVEMIIRASGKHVQLVDAPVPDDDGEGHARWYWGDYGKMAREFAWEPRFTLEQAVGDMVESFAATTTPSLAGQS